MIPNELSVGNIVGVFGAENSWTTVDDICSVTEKEIEFFKKGGLTITDTHFVVVGRKMNGGAIVLLSYIRPIQLTPQILLKINKESKPLFWDLGKGCSMRRDMFYYGSRPIRTVSVLHDLQNLFYNLTKTRLNVVL